MLSCKSELERERDARLPLCLLEFVLTLACWLCLGVTVVLARLWKVLCSLHSATPLLLLYTLVGSWPNGHLTGVASSGRRPGEVMNHVQARLPWQVCNSRRSVCQCRCECEPTRPRTNQPQCALRAVFDCCFLKTRSNAHSTHS